MIMTPEALQQEFDRQVAVLIRENYPSRLKKSVQEFTESLLPLKQLITVLKENPPNLETGYLPFVIVISLHALDSEFAMSRTRLNGKPGITKLTPLSPADFQEITGETIPQGFAYILAGIDRGKYFLNITPFEALVRIRQTGRLPLTINEGIAVITQYPDFLRKNNCFSLLASRHPGDKRVPAIWINGDKHPNLGWCWEKNPHTWLGSASAQKRLGY